jgi:cytochrome P450
MAAASVFNQILDYSNRANPYPLYAELRKTPVVREDDGTYLVSTYPEIVALLHDPRLSSDRRNYTGYVAGSDEGGRALGLPPDVASLDSPEHDRARRLLMRHFGPPHTPDMIDRMVPDFVEIVTGLIDNFARRNRVDVVDDFAFPFPVTVISRILGVPREDEPLFHQWSKALIESTEMAMAEMSRYMDTLAATRRDHPVDDMFSGLVTDDGPDGRLSRGDLMANAALLLVAGHETTVNLITNGMLTCCATTYSNVCATNRTWPLAWSRTRPIARISLRHEWRPLLS